MSKKNQREEAWWEAAFDHDVLVTLSVKQLEERRIIAEQRLALAHQNLLDHAYRMIDALERLLLNHIQFLRAE